MSNQVFVSNLAFSTTDEGLNGHCSSLGLQGVVSAAVQMKGERSKGWGLVDFDTAANAGAAVAKLDGTTLDGRQVRARESKDSAARGTTTAAAPKSAPAPVENNDPTDQLFVGNLPWDTTTEEMLALFTGPKPESGEVAKRLSGRSKGYGTVKFASVHDATAALNQLTGKTIGDRTLTVRYDRQAPATVNDRLFVGNLPWSVTSEQLNALFSAYNITSAEVKTGSGGRSRGFGIVQFADPAEAAKSLQRDEFEVEGRTVFVRYDRAQ